MTTWQRAQAAGRADWPAVAASTMVLRLYPHRMAREQAFGVTVAVLLRGAILIGLVTAVFYRAGLNSASMALLYLIAIVVQSLDCTFFEAAITSVMAVAGLDYFFMDPPFSLSVSHSSDVVTLACLMITALVVTRTQSQIRVKARESRLQQQSAEQLFKAGQQLLALSPEAMTGAPFLAPFVSVFELDAASLFDAASLTSYSAGTSRGDLESKTREAYISGRNAVYPELRIVVQCLQARDTIFGAIGFEGLQDSETTAAALAGLAASHLERIQTFKAAADAAAQAQAQMLRSVILDALAHEIKTPLATILTAAGGLRAAGSMGPEQSELAEMIETETSRLADLTSGLLRLARLDRDEVKPRLELTDLAELTGRTVRRYSKIFPDRRILFQDQGNVPEIRVDSELVALTISQLLENACKYSHPDAGVSVDLSAVQNSAVVAVWNDGAPIAADERYRVFDRFYRGNEARRTAAGSGLGLYVARKIARAHGGDLELADTGADGVSFRLSLPISRNGEADVSRNGEFPF